MKVAIVGIGRVGAMLAYTVVGDEIADEVVLVGRNLPRLQGETLDLRHAASFADAPPSVACSTVSELHEADVVVLTLSVPQTDGDRNAMAVDNARLFADVVPRLSAQNPNCLFVVATNPVEALTQFTIELSGFPAHRVIGTGTVIDSCRLRAALSEQLAVHPDDVRAYVLGEHGEGQFLWESGTTVGGVRLDRSDIPEQLVEETRTAGGDIFALKGYTSYAICRALALILRSICGNHRRTMPVSTQIEPAAGLPSLCLALPCVVGREGVVKKLVPKFNPAENQLWLECAQSVAATLARIHASVPFKGTTA